MHVGASYQSPAGSASGKVTDIVEVPLTYPGGNHIQEFALRIVLEGLPGCWVTLIWHGLMGCRGAVGHVAAAGQQTSLSKMANESGSAVRKPAGHRRAQGDVTDGPQNEQTWFEGTLDPWSGQPGAASAWTHEVKGGCSADVAT